MILMLYICPCFWTSKYPWYFFGVILWICDIQSGFIIHECWRLIIHPCFFLWPPFLSFSNLLKQWLYRDRFDVIICTCWRINDYPSMFLLMVSLFKLFKSYIWKQWLQRQLWWGGGVFSLSIWGNINPPLEANHNILNRILIFNHIILIIESDLQTAH